VLGSGPRDIIIDSTFDRDSVVRFIAACEGANLSLTQSNVFELELLCDEWPVTKKSIHRKITEFIEPPPSGKSLWIHRLLFRFGRGLSTSEAEEWFRRNLARWDDDLVALEIPVAVLPRIIDFRAYEVRQGEFGQLFTFCMNDLKSHDSSTSQIMRTLDVTQLSDTDLGRLCALDRLVWDVLKQSVCHGVMGLRNKLFFAEKHKGELETKVRDQAQEIRQMKEEKKAMKMKEDQLIEEVGKLKEEIRWMAARIPPPKTSIPFPPSVKKGKLRICDCEEYGNETDTRYDIPEGSINHVKRECARPPRGRCHIGVVRKGD
jgi:hypothetical protein